MFQAYRMIPFSTTSVESSAIQSTPPPPLVLLPLTSRARVAEMADPAPAPLADFLRQTEGTSKVRIRVAFNLAGAYACVRWFSGFYGWQHK